MIFGSKRRGFIYWTSKCHIFHWRLFYNYYVLISLIKRRQGACSEDQNTSLQKRTFCYIVATAHIIYVGCNVHVALFAVQVNDTMHCVILDCFALQLILQDHFCSSWNEYKLTVSCSWIFFTYRGVHSTGMNS